DAGFAGDQKHQAATPRERFVEPARQGTEFPLASDHRIETASTKLSGAAGLRSANLGDEPVTLAWHGDHQSRRVRVVAQRSAELAHRRVDSVINIEEYPLAPEALENFLARHKLSPLVDQQKQQVERNTFEF